MDNKFGTGQILKNVNELKRTLPKILANQAQNFFMESWDKQGWDDGSVQKWKEVKRREPGTPEYKYPKTYGLTRRTNPILVGGGSIKGSAGGKLRRAAGMSIRTATFDQVKLVVATGYGKYLNDGTDHIPKRKFMGDSKTLKKMQLASINQAVDKVFKDGRN